MEQSVTFALYFMHYKFKGLGRGDLKDELWCFVLI